MGDPAQLLAIGKDFLTTYLWKKFSISIIDDPKQQDNKEFQILLAEVRFGKVSDETDRILRKKFQVKKISILDMENSAISCSLGKEQNKQNKKFLDAINGEEQTFKAEETNISD